MIEIETRGDKPYRPWIGVRGMVLVNDEDEPYYSYIDIARVEQSYCGETGLRDVLELANAEASRVCGEYDSMSFIYHGTVLGRRIASEFILSSEFISDVCAVDFMERALIIEVADMIRDNWNGEWHG